MGTKGAALAKQFETKAHDAMATLQQLSEGDWKKVTDAESGRWGSPPTTSPARSNRSPA
jgi:hypothetical protein